MLKNKYIIIKVCEQNETDLEKYSDITNEKLYKSVNNDSSELPVESSN